MSLDIVYFSNYSGNTKRFVEKINYEFGNIIRIPIDWDASSPTIVSNG